MPAVDAFDYGFESLTAITLALLDELGLDRFALYVQDHGAPIGLRIGSRHPERVTALISQSGNAYQEGFTPRVAPETWLLDQAGLDRPDNDAIQLQLFWDYQFVLEAYPDFQRYFRTHRPPTLLTWGRNDEIFGPAGAEAFLRDLPDAELHLLDAGHFALETHGPEITALVREFMRRVDDTAGG